MAAELGKTTGLAARPALLKRVKRTPALKGMSLSQRKKLVSGTFSEASSADLEGRTVVLIDDVPTTCRRPGAPPMPAQRPSDAPASG
jgi:predicted amidophosphoribosyltransferase